MVVIETAPPDFNDGADAQILECLNPAAPKSFFLYAGAGSGKTRSLKNALDGFRDAHGAAFRRLGKKIAVITYTNAAADEIAERVGQDSLFPISTIHSFCWQHIETYHADIQAWLLKTLPANLADLHKKQAKGRAGKAALDRERAIASTNRRIEWLSVPRRFTYNPNGDNFGQDSLSHSEVLKITAAFIETKPSMRAVLVNKYPFLLIDESQDTSKVLLEAFFTLAAANEGKFGMGLFGDTMQRIFLDGHPELESLVPDSWARPVKRLNHRSPQRVIALGNVLRAPIDRQYQVARDDSGTGIVRLFVASSATPDKPGFEQRVRDRMAELCGDSAWCKETEVKTLTLEHHMAASRRGFLEMFQALDQDSRLSTGLRTGEIAGLRLFTERVAPLVAAARAKDGFAVMAHLRATSPLLKRASIVQFLTPDDLLLPIRVGVEALLALNPESPTTTFLAVLECVAKHQLFEIPAALRPFVAVDHRPEAIAAEEIIGVEESEPADGTELDSPASLEAWRAFLETPFRQTIPFAEYISDRRPFGTHQGVKGLEFERVLVILDDSDARGFLFSYEKLFEAKPLSDTDRKHLADATDGGITRTRRLLYVTCTRAEKSLALVAYTQDPDAVITAVIRNQWFSSDEVERL
ncbi:MULTISPECIES: UvrD-helicase domain-containing protein [Gluconobacter]|uniref:UvrD-helicase domain-containing protein n=1 Tax=Gluconobacter TaxID=441 RepID=UPI000A390B5D|nr:MULTISPECIES: UvrD-helicase domain-containing protein [Gluconobacter]MBS1039074.1 UvrD-helicase domain-containing protein [Gluconobacter cerinus]OUJ06681.1 Fis family transcriptional regulator [Gluconobacter sp. DsW_058]